MVCGSIGCRFKSFFSPILKFINTYNYFNNFFSLILFYYVTKLTRNFNFFIKYWKNVELLWEDALLCDFLQKKIVDSWIKKFLITSSYLVNEKFFFENIIKFFLNLIIWPWNRFFFFEINTVSNLLLIIFLFFFLIFYFIFIIYIFTWMF